MIGKIISHYKILEKLGGGGMGVVYKAEDTKLKRTVALKFLLQDLTRDEEAKKRFMHEAQAASVLDHPNIGTIYEVDQTDDGQMFIVMAYYQGETLKAKIERGPQPIDEAIEIALQIAQGLAKAHGKDIVHRDIKPANIMMTTDNVIKIVDFGLAKLAGRTKLTKDDSTLGTAAYMSPEQAQGLAVDNRSDIFSLGVVLYEALTGQVPFKGDYEQAVVYSILHEDPEPITGLRTGVPMELERIVNKAIAKNPDERYQHTDEMLVDLKTLRKQLESGVKKTTTHEAYLKRRKRAFIPISFVALFILLILAAFYILTDRNKGIESLAVLPLANLSGDADQDYFADGMTEALITALSKITALRVISRTSVMRYKGEKRSLPEIARELNVDAVLEGSVLRAGERVRITVQLIHADTEQHLWVDNYDRQLIDILALHSDVARAIAKEIRITLTANDKMRLAKTHRVNPEAYEDYLKGIHFFENWSGFNLRKSLKYFEQAIEKDSSYAPAYAWYANINIALGFVASLKPFEAFPSARVAATKALKLDNTLSEGYVALGLVKLFFDWDWLGAEEDFKHAIELSPNSSLVHDAYSYFLMAMGQKEENIAEMRRAHGLDPLSFYSNLRLGWSYHMAGYYDEAIAQYIKTHELYPKNRRPHYYSAKSYAKKGMFAEALAEYEKVQRENAWVYAIAGKTDEARKVLEAILSRGYRRPVSIAEIFAALGEHDRAFEELGKAYEERSPDLVFIRLRPQLDNLRSDPRFTQLLKKMGLEK